MLHYINQEASSSKRQSQRAAATVAVEDTAVDIFIAAAIACNASSDVKMRAVLVATACT